MLLNTLLFSEKQLNGTLMNCYATCHKKLWLQARHIHTNKENIYIQMGKAYSQIHMNKRFGNIEVDEITKNKHIIIKEYKKTFSNIKASRLQLLFYMFELRNEIGLKKVEGFLISEESQEKIHLVCGLKEEKELKKSIKEALSIINSSNPPEFIQTKLCQYCGHNFYCL